MSVSSPKKCPGPKSVTGRPSVSARSVPECTTYILRRPGTVGLGVLGTGISYPEPPRGYFLPVVVCRRMMQFKHLSGPFFLPSLRKVTGAAKCLPSWPPSPELRIPRAEFTDFCQKQFTGMRRTRGRAGPAARPPHRRCTGPPPSRPRASRSASRSSRSEPAAKRRFPSDPRTISDRSQKNLNWSWCFM